MQNPCKIFVAVFTVIVHLHLVKNDEVSSNSSVSYKFGTKLGVVSYGLELPQFNTQVDTVEIGFVTSDCCGCLLNWIDYETRSETQISIDKGYVFATYSRNYSTTDQLCYKSVKVDDNTYHEVKLKREQHQLLLQVDNQTIIKSNNFNLGTPSSTRGYGIVELGLPTHHYEVYTDTYNHTVVFSGIISKVVINGVNILNLRNKNRVKIIVRGDVEVINLSSLPPNVSNGTNKEPLNSQALDDLIYSPLDVDPECITNATGECIPNYDYRDDIIRPVYRPSPKPQINHVTNKFTSDDECDDEDCLYGSGSGSGSGLGPDDSGVSSSTVTVILTTSTTTKTSTKGVPTTTVAPSTSDFHWVNFISTSSVSDTTPPEEKTITEKDTTESVSSTSPIPIGTNTKINNQSVPSSEIYTYPMETSTLHVDYEQTETELYTSTESYPEPDNVPLLSKEMAIMMAFSVGILITIIVALVIFVECRSRKKKSYTV